METDTSLAALPPAIDAAVIEGLRALSPEGGMDIVADLTTAFVDDGQDRLRKLHEALQSGDEVAARRAAHSLKGMSGSIGAMHLSTLSGELERAEPGTITPDSVDVLEQEFHRVTAALKAA